MADTVNAILERMLPELEDLEKWGLFTRSEIKEIVRRRREFEYQLKRPSRIKEDFLRYVEYEQQLDSLRHIRKKLVLRGLKESGQKWTGHLYDRAGINRILGIYKRAVMKFKSDLGLWLQYLEYCRKKSPREMRRVLARALQLHPDVPGLWMYAASWDFEHNLNVTAARSLMQRGLRMCPHSQQLWLEYFRMELTYAQKLKARKAILGITSTPSVTEGGQDNTPQANPDSELSVKLARVIFRNAIIAVPSCPIFRQKFIQALHGFDIPQSQTIEAEICASMMNDFPTDERVWDWKARRCLQISPSRTAWEQASKVYEEALQSIPSARMFELYAKFLEDLLTSPEVDKERVTTSLIKLYERGQQHCPNINLLEGQIRMLVREGSLEKARAIASESCKGPLRRACRLWVLRLSLEIQNCGSEEDDNRIAKLFGEALKLVEASEAKELWRMVLEYFAGKRSHFINLFQRFEASLGGKGAAQAAADVACSTVDWFLHCDGIKKAREVYNRLLLLPGPSLQLFRHCISLEAARAALGDQEALGCMRKVFDAAVEIYGKQDIELWLDYCAHERTVGTADAAITVYSRAKKALVEPSLFVQKHQLLFP